MVVKGFKLDQVLNFRKEVEKQHILEYAAARQELEKAKASLVQVLSEMAALDKEFHEKQRVGIDAVELQLYADFSMRKKLDIQIRKQVVESLTVEVEVKRDLLLDAAKDKKVLEIYKEKKTDDHKREIAGKERAFLDELAVQKRGPRKP
jgi:flagellar FliJ protein